MTPEHALAWLEALLRCPAGVRARRSTRRVRGREHALRNTIVENDSLLNPIDFSYVYNGAGVAVGDFDGDDRPDLYFAGNTVDNALYLNRGDFEFEEVTEQANAAAEGAWSTGVATVDINQDGLMDVYVCVAGPASRDSARANRLFVNQGLDDNGVPTFREAAEAYGIADTGYSTQAAFFDYDRDGDLDLYLLTNAIDQSNRNAPRPIKTKGQAPSTDRLYRNEGDGTFTNVSEEAGIQTEGFGLGAAVSDLNQDGWPDVYVANDFLSNDLLWMNQGDGTFENRLGEVTKHQTHNGMGNDVADFNNDGRPDIAVVDMLPPDNERKKLMLPGRSYNVFHMALRRGYEPQYLRNTLQLNRGRSPAGDPAFSEIGQLAGVHATDWSWAPLFADFNNDGHKDLFISNGYGKDVTNLDHIKYGQQTANFGTPEAKRKQAIKAMKNLDEVRLQNYVFKNDGDLTFTDKSEAWGMGPSSISNGAAYADFDGDGDLDLVTNNIDDEAFILKNRARERATGDDQQNTARYLRVELKGPQGNRAGYGAKVVLQNGGGRTQYIDHSPYRGYKSTTGRTLHFGLGAASAVPAAGSPGAVSLRRATRGNAPLSRRRRADRPYLRARRKRSHRLQEDAASSAPALPARPQRGRRRPRRRRARRRVPRRGSRQKARAFHAALRRALRATGPAGERPARGRGAPRGPGGAVFRRRRGWRRRPLRRQWGEPRPGRQPGLPGPPLPQRRGGPPAPCHGWRSAEDPGQRFVRARRRLRRRRRSGPLRLRAPHAGTLPAPAAQLRPAQRLGGRPRDVY
ncbi:MAG: hypothetical protein BRD38_03885 [Bacteroidetes bacterium QH_9_67_14]|nr:MAG: hypothetical protein BRD38_03885 [Bacteroidetes bacterium QH_9_67_14]